MQLLITLAGFTLISFLIFFLVNKRSRESYLLFNAYFLPLMSLGVTPVAFGGFQVFDALAYMAFFFFIKDFFSISRENRLYIYLSHALIIILLAGSLYSEFLNNSLISILVILPIFIFSRLLLRELSVNPELRDKIIRAFKFSFLIAMAFIILQKRIGIQFTFYRELNPNVTDEDGIRYPGYFMDAQINAQFLAMLGFLFLINFKNITKPTLVNYGLFGMAVIAVFLSGGRSGFFGFTVGFCFLMVWLGWRMRYFIVLAGLAIVVLLPSLENAFILFRRLNSVDESYQFRAYIWKEAYDIFLDHQLLGIGAGNYKDFVNRHSTDQYYLQGDNTVLLLDQPESGYLKVLAEFGLFGFVIAFLLILIPVAKAFYIHLQKRTNHFSLFFIASIICWLVSFNSLYTLSDKRIAIVLASLVCFVIQSTHISTVSEEDELIIPLKEQLSPL